MPFGVSRIAECDVYHPTTIHMLKAKSLDKDHVLNYLTKFLDDYDKTLTTAAVTGEKTEVDESYVGPNPTTISQLKRLQRELKGLPPVMLEEAPLNQDKVEKPKNKKIVFGDEPAKKADDEDQDVPKYVSEESVSEDDSESEDEKEKKESEGEESESEKSASKEDAGKIEEEKPVEPTGTKRKAEEELESEEPKKHEHKHKHHKHKHDKN